MPPSPRLSHSTLRPLARPAYLVLQRMLADLPASELAQPGWRSQLIAAADSLLTSEAPEARLVDSGSRKGLLREVLEDLLPAHRASEPASSAASIETAAEPVSLPLPSSLREAGFRGFTVHLMPGAEATDGAAKLRSILGDQIVIDPIPSLSGYWTIRLTGTDKPLVSEAWEAAGRIRQTPPFDYAEPNLAVPAYPAPDSAALESFTGPGDWDRNHPATAADFEWSLERIGANAFWGKSKGSGVVVGHIDTGYTLHPELKPCLDRNRDWDFWAGDADAQDPLEDGWWDKFRAKSPVLNPGHGTGTASVIASPAGRQVTTAGTAWVTGAAPEATVIPYRATPTVVILPLGSQDEVARAIVKASDDGVDVISMSLGSPLDSQLLRDAVGHALDAGVIVCAAAGNIVAEWVQGTGVTFPAKYPSVVGVAGCDYDYKAWKYSCRGPEVDITVGGTDVWRAVATNDLNNAVVERSSGTSFAVATVAGVAACWVGFHGGRAAIRNHFGGNARLVPLAFQYCLRQHAKTALAEGDSAQFGGGVLNGQSLAAIPMPAAAVLLPSPGAPALMSVLPWQDAPSLPAEVGAALGDWASTLDSFELKELATHLALQPVLLAAWRNRVRPARAASPTAEAGFAGGGLGGATALGLSASLRAKLNAGPGTKGAMAAAAAYGATRAPSGTESAQAPQLKHVVAFCLHESERALASSAMDPNLPGKQNRSPMHSTRSFVMGEATEAEIADLRAHQLAVFESKPPDTAAVSHFEIATARAFSAEAASEEGGTFLMRLVGPMLTPRRTQLEEVCGVKILELLAPELYRIAATRAQAADVRNLRYIASIFAESVAPPTSLQSFGVSAREFAPASPATPLALPEPFDLWLSAGVEAAGFAAALRARGYQVLSAADRKLRVLVVPGSPEARALKLMPEVGGNMEPFVAPSLHLSHARSLIGLAPAGTPPSDFPWTGQGQLIAIADTGLDQDHPDLKNQVQSIVALGRPGLTDDPVGHGTHVAGAAAGDGTASNGLLKGAAPSAKLYFQSILGPPIFSDRFPLSGLPVALSQLFDPAYAAGARIHNNSWGSLAFSNYRMASREVDEYVQQHPDFLVVISGGNDGGTSAPVPPGQRRSASGSVDWYSISSPATAKNALSVGASQSDLAVGGLSDQTYHQIKPDRFPLANLPGDVAGALLSGTPEELAGFSSRGPTGSLQVKPDLVAPGTSIVSARSGQAAPTHFEGIYAANPQYAYLSGTSMAAPIVSGCAALVREYYARHRDYASPSAALIKATLINGTRILTGTQATAAPGGFPNGHQGFGRIDMRRTLPAPVSPDFFLFFFDTWRNEGRGLTIDDWQRFFFSLSPGVPWLRLCLAYTDLPGNCVQNSLVLQLHNTTTNTKWWGNENQQASLAPLLPAPDRFNNVLIIRIESPAAGDYVLAVQPANLPLGGAQEYALVITAPNLPAIDVRNLND